MSALPPRSGESPRRGVSRLEMMQVCYSKNYDTVPPINFFNPIFKMILNLAMTDCLPFYWWGNRFLIPSIFQFTFF